MRIHAFHFFREMSASQKMISSNLVFTHSSGRQRLADASVHVHCAVRQLVRMSDTAVRLSHFDALKRQPSEAQCRWRRVGDRPEGLELELCAQLLLSQLQLEQLHVRLESERYELLLHAQKRSVQNMLLLQ